MGDLISRKVLLAKVVEANPMGGMIGGKFVEDLIKSEPIAYDVSKAVKRLENEFKKYYGDNWDKAPYLVKAIEIVKGGGKT